MRQKSRDTENVEIIHPQFLVLGSLFFVLCSWFLVQFSSAVSRQPAVSGRARLGDGSFDNEGTVAAEERRLSSVDCFGFRDGECGLPRCYHEAAENPN